MAREKASQDAGARETGEALAHAAQPVQALDRYDAPGHVQERPSCVSWLWPLADSRLPLSALRPSLCCRPLSRFVSFCGRLLSIHRVPDARFARVAAPR